MSYNSKFCFLYSGLFFCDLDYFQIRLPVIMFPYCFLCNQTFNKIRTFLFLYGIGDLEKSIRKNYWSFSSREKLSTPGVLSKLSKCIISPQTHSQKYELLLLGNKRKTYFDDAIKSLFLSNSGKLSFSLSMCCEDRKIHTERLSLGFIIFQ